MVLDLLKWLKETSFYEKKKEIIKKTWTLHKTKVNMKKRERFYEFFGLRKSWYYRWSSFSIYESCMILQEMRIMIFQFTKKKKKKKPIRLYCL